MDGLEALRILAEHRTDEVVVTTMSAAKEWPFFSRRQELDLPLIGCMGKASSLGLGLALAQPDRRVLVLDGDGSLLMNLGSLATIAGMAPRNFGHYLFDNGTYDTTGGQPVPNPGRVDFAALALAAGYAHAWRFDEANDLRAALSEIMRSDGPYLVTLKVGPGWSTHPFPERQTFQAMAEVAEVLRG